MVIIDANPNTQWIDNDKPTTDLNFLWDGENMAIWDGNDIPIYFHTGVRREVENQEWNNIL